MGTLLQEKLKTEKEERQEIERRVLDAPIHSSEEEGKIIKSILADVSKKFTADISTRGFDNSVVEKIEAYVKAAALQVSDDYEAQKRIERVAMSNIVGLGPIQPYMDDPAVTEIVVQRYDLICIERNGFIQNVEASFLDETHLRTIINRIIQKVNRQLNLYTPMVDARLPDGSRVNATIPPATPDGATMTIRKFSNKALTGEQYINLGSISPQMLAFLKACVHARISLIVSGGTNSGKTTLLNMLSSYIPESELIVTIEDSCELKLHQKNVRRMETRQQEAEGMLPVTIQTLVKNSLRMRPDRIVIGEIRDGAIVDLMSAMSTGHEGSMSTVHANSPRNLINARMPILYSMNPGMSFSEEAQKTQIAEALQIIVQIAHGRDGKRRITHITNVCGVDKENGVILKDIFLYEKGAYHATGYIPEDIVDIIKSRGVSLDMNCFDSSVRWGDEEIAAYKEAHKNTNNQSNKETNTTNAPEAKASASATKDENKPDNRQNQRAQNRVVEGVL